MKETEKILQDTGETIEYAKQYIESQKAFLKLDVAERMSRVTSKLAMAGIMFILGLFILSMLSISVALFLGQLFGSIALGFLCVTAFYALILCFIIVFKKSLIINPTITMVLKAFFS